MYTAKPSFPVSLAIISMVFLAACAEPEILLPHSSETPPGVDFSGMWDIRADSSGDQRRLREVINNTDGIDDYRLKSTKGSSSGTSRSRSRAKGGVVQIFLEVGSSLKVTQTEYALFLSFDRSVVEEFRFGEDRMVNIGVVQVMRVSGWEGDNYVVETLDKSGMKLTERYAISDDRKVLTRNIIFRSNKLEEDSLTQTFDRVD